MTRTDHGWRRDVGDRPIAIHHLLVILMMLSLPASVATVRVWGGEAGPVSDEGKAGREAEGDEEQQEEPPLRFTDEDLLKYHRPTPGPDEESESRARPGGEPAPAAQNETRRAPAPVTTRKRTAPGGSPESVSPKPVRKGIGEPDGGGAARLETMRTLRDRIARTGARLVDLRQRRSTLIDQLQDPPEVEPAGVQRESERRRVRLGLARVEDAIKTLEAQLRKSRAHLVWIQTRFEAGSPTDSVN